MRSFQTVAVILQLNELHGRAFAPIVFPFNFIKNVKKNSRLARVEIDESSQNDSNYL